MKESRREAIRKMAVAPALLTAPILWGAITTKDKTEPASQRLQYSVNAYSFNDELKEYAFTLYCNSWDAGMHIPLTMSFEVVKWIYLT